MQALGLLGVLFCIATSALVTLGLWASGLPKELAALGGMLSGAMLGGAWGYYRAKGKLP